MRYDQSPMTLADFLYENSLSPAWLRRALAVKHRSTVWRWLTGERIPNPKTIARIEDLTSGVVTMHDFLDPSPPKCMRVITDKDGNEKSVLPWSPEADRARAYELDERTSRLSPPILRALRVLNGRAWYTPRGRMLLDGRVCDFRALVRAANEVLRGQGKPPIKYPGVDPIDDD